MPMVTSVFAVAMMVGQLIFITNLVKTLQRKPSAETKKDDRCAHSGQRHGAAPVHP